MKEFRCPNCGANLSFEGNRDFGFCQYCGTKILLDDYRSTHRIVDEARIKEAEVEQIVRLKELEIQMKEIEKEEKAREKSRKIRIIYIAVGVGLILISIIGWSIFPPLYCLAGIVIGGCVLIGSRRNAKNKER